MSERYSKLFALPENLYASGAPVVIAAGALLKDNQTGKVIAQLKMRNIGANIIKAVKVCIHPLDTVGNALGAEVEYQYLDLAAKRNEEFGAKSPISLADAATRAYSASVAEVVFTDNTVWKATDEPWEALSAPPTLDAALKDSELLKQYRIKYGTDCRYSPTVQKDLWYCVCGELNRKNETVCHHCGKSLAALQAIDISALKADRDARIVAEKQKAAEDKAAADAKVKKTKKLAMIAAPIVVLIIIASVIISNSVKAKQEEAARLDSYNSAVALLDAGQYEEAIEIFTVLGEYKDSKAQLQKAEAGKAEAEQEAEREAIYNSALSALSDGNDEIAYELFQKLGDYKDAALYQLEYLVSTKKYTYPDYNICQTTEYEYDSEGRLICSTYYQTSASEPDITEYYYDNDGKMFSVRENYWMYNSSGNALTAYPSTTTSEYNEHGDIIASQMLYDRILSDGTRINERVYEYSYHYEYNADGTMAVKSYVFTSDQLQEDGTRKTETSEYTITYEYTYDENGRVLTCTEYNGTTAKVSEYSYDAFGNVISIKIGDTETTFEYIGKLSKQETE